MSSMDTYLMVDDKKMKRKMSNRESAKRSRMKKEQHMKDLNDQIFYFTQKRDEMAMKVERTEKWHAEMSMENMVLRSQKQELEKRLEYANNVRGWCEGEHGHVSGSLNGGVVHEPWLRPWGQHQGSSSMHVKSSAGYM